MELKTSISFVIETEVSSTFFVDLLRFVYENYLISNDHFIDVELRSFDKEHILSFVALVPEAHRLIHAKVKAGENILVELTSDAGITKEAIDELKQDLILNVQLFEEKIRRTTLYFAWVEGEKVIPEKKPQTRHHIFYRVFSGGMLLLSILFLTLNIILFVFLGPYAPITLVGFQFIIVLLSDRIIEVFGDWRITERNPNIHFIQYELPIEDYQSFQQKYGRDALNRIKAEIYEKTFAAGRTLNCEISGEILSKYGFECDLENMTTKTVNVYKLVEKAAKIFGIPFPKIVVSNSTLPNAAASGPSPRQGVILITTGLLIQLEDDEILSVIGHEFSHLKNRDSLVLFGLTTTEFLLRFYLFWPLLIYFGLIDFGLYYLVISLGVLYFITKFFESRADLDSAISIGQPKVLADALRKIAFNRLQFERIRPNKIRDWLGWDTHPPIYFRVNRLENLKPQRVKHTMIQSIKDNIEGFVKVLH